MQSQQVCPQEGLAHRQLHCCSGTRTAWSLTGGSETSSRAGGQPGLEELHPLPALPTAFPGAEPCQPSASPCSGSAARQDRARGLQAPLGAQSRGWSRGEPAGRVPVPPHHGHRAATPASREREGAQHQRTACNTETACNTACNTGTPQAAGGT